MNPKRFQNVIYSHYQKHKRTFPWRETTDPYHILVSEVMLQQTQVSRGLIKYPEFLHAFPTVKSLARAPLSKVLRVWQGLGYNRRALLLQRAAQEIMKTHQGTVPQSYAELVQLPGVGPATAAGIMNFAFNKPTPYLETNTRAVFIHFFFPNRKRVLDNEIVPFLQKTVDAKNPRQWYWALLDYGAWLKKSEKNPTQRSAHYARQSAFVGSHRQVRSMVLRYILERQSANEAEIAARLTFEKARIKQALKELLGEGFIARRKSRYTIT